MSSRMPLVVTLALLAAAVANQLLPRLAAAAPTSTRLPAADDTGAVPRLVRTARLEASMPASCYPSVTATLSADGHTAILGCVLWASEYASTKRAWAVLSDVFPDGRWRIVGRLRGIRAGGHVRRRADNRDRRLDLPKRPGLRAEGRRLARDRRRRSRQRRPVL